MHVNKVQLGGPEEEEHPRSISSNTAKGMGRSRHGRSALPLMRSGTGFTARTNGPIRSRCSTAAANSSRNVGFNRQRRRRIAAPRGHCRRKERQVSSSSTAATIACRSSPPRAISLVSAATPARVLGEFNQPWGITLDKDGNIYVADWKNHRIQKLSSAGKLLDDHRLIWSNL